MELCGAALFAGAAARFGYAWDLPAYLAFLAGLLALSWIDVELLVLPKRIVYPMSLIVAGLFLLAAGATGNWHGLLVGSICAAAWFALFLAMYLVSPRLIGFGDVRLAPVLGLALGWLGVSYVILGFLAANLIGAVVGLTLIAMKRIERAERVPYGVFLAAGCAVAIFAGPELLSPFSGYHL